MLKSWRLGSVLGFPIEINISFLFLLGLVLFAFGGVVGLMITCLAFASILVHELGHALVARRRGVHVSGIELSFFGGAAKMVQMPQSSNDELAIAVAGPVVSLALGGAGLGLAALVGSPLLATVGWINLVIAGFNLIPALPMDGGRILRALLARKMDFVRATDLSVTVARVVAVGFGILGLMGAYQLLVLAPFLWLMGSRERVLARMMADQYVGMRRGNVEVLGRRAGDQRGGGGWDSPMRRYTIRQRDGRFVIEAID